MIIQKLIERKKEDHDREDHHLEENLNLNSNITDLKNMIINLYSKVENILVLIKNINHPPPGTH